MSTLDAIRGRLEAATPGPWTTVRRDLALFVESEDAKLQVNLGYIGNRPEREAEFIAHAPTDMARLLAAVEALENLAASWTARGEHDMAFSKTIPDENIATHLLTEGASMVENARHIRNALTDALEGKA